MTESDQYNLTTNVLSKLDHKEIKIMLTSIQKLLFDIHKNK